MKLLKILKKVKNMLNNKISDTTSDTTSDDQNSQSSGISSQYNSGMSTANMSSSYFPFTSSLVGVGNITTTAATNYTGIGNTYNIGSYVLPPEDPSTIIIFYSSNINKTEIVRLNKDGSVKWANGIEIDEAAESFSKSLSIGVEMKVGITQGVKYRMRDSVFEDLISIAEEKGPLSAEDLTYLLSASKIVEKLKGYNE